MTSQKANFSTETINWIMCQSLINHGEAVPLPVNDSLHMKRRRVCGCLCCGMVPKREEGGHVLGFLFFFLWWCNSPKSAAQLSEFNWPNRATQQNEDWPDMESQWHRARILTLESQTQARPSVVTKWMGDHCCDTKLIVQWWNWFGCLHCLVWWCRSWPVKDWKFFLLPPVYLSVVRLYTTCNHYDLWARFCTHPVKCDFSFHQSQILCRLQNYFRWDYSINCSPLCVCIHVCKVPK